MLDAKEYPLAVKPTPTELKKISYTVDDESMSFFGDEFRTSAQKVCVFLPLLPNNEKSLENSNDNL